MATVRPTARTTTKQIAVPQPLIDMETAVQKVDLRLDDEQLARLPGTRLIKHVAHRHSKEFSNIQPKGDLGQTIGARSSDVLFCAASPPCSGLFSP
jgi:hypothetical protein